MDLIGASNTPEPVTVNPLTGNAIAGFTTSDIDMDTSEDTSGSTAEPMSDSSTYTTDKTRTVYPFESLKPGQQDSVIRLHSEIAHAWDIASPASPFPYEYQPDPDVLNWGHAILIALSRLAQMTRLPKSLQGQAVQHVIDHIRERNDGFSALEGDHVLRVEDIQYAIRMMRPAETHSYRPSRGCGSRGRYGRGRARGRGRGSR